MESPDSSPGGAAHDSPELALSLRRDGSPGYAGKNGNESRGDGTKSQSELG